MKLYFGCFRSSITDLSIIVFINNYWNWSGLLWVIITTSLIWGIRIVLNVFFRRRLTKIIKNIKQKYFTKDERIL
jgi:hypothetical protein